MLTATAHDAATALAGLPAGSIGRGDPLALCVVPGRGLALAAANPVDDDPGGLTVAVACDDPAAVVADLEGLLRPRWIWWSAATPTALLDGGAPLATCWDIAAVHRLLFGGWPADPGRAWAALHALDETSLPGSGQLDLLSSAGGADSGGDPERPVQPDGHLRPEWAGGGWQRDYDRWRRWAAAAATAYRRQAALLADPPEDALRRRSTAQSESAAELLCAELSHDGLPMDRAAAEQIIASFVGPRPTDADDAAAIRHRRDEAVRQHVPGLSVDLRSPAQVKAMLARVGIEVSDTRSWRLEAFRGAHPVVAALLAWRKDERMATTYGYDWLERQLGADGRLRGSWTGCDGGAGRMTASAGLHSMPAELRPAVAAAAGQVLVRADLGQIEPRVLAAVSGDRGLIAATADADLYAPVAERLRVDRPTAKVAVLAAMYGQTSGAAGEALKAMDSAYPIAMRYLRAANEAGRAGRDVRTHGGRLVRMYQIRAGLEEQQERAQLAGRGRYARNAVVQGAAAEFFKAWAATVRSRGRALQAQIVLCLHDELLVHCPSDRGDDVAQLLHDSLAATAAGYGRADVAGRARFVADVSVINRWSEAKG